MNIKIIGQYITQFGELWDKSLQDLLYEAIDGAVQNAGLEPRDIEAVFVGNKASGSFNSQRQLGSIASTWFDHFPPASRIEGACASGSLAVLAAEHALLSGVYRTVLVVGVEKMTDVSGGRITDILATAADNQLEYGSTFPALYAMLAKDHMYKFGTTRQELSAVSVKNHAHAFKNKDAQFHKHFSLEQVSNSTVIADPLRLLDCSPISDGAAAIVMTTKKSPHLAKIIGVGHAHDSVDLSGRSSLTELNATKKAAKEAFTMAQNSLISEGGCTPKNIDYAEVHDCFTIAEIMAIEDLGFFEKGAGGKATLEGRTGYRGIDSSAGLINTGLFKNVQVVVNPSGGLKACGHPVGATGVKQLAYLSKILSEEKGKKAIAHNVGGSGAVAVVHILIG